MGRLVVTFDHAQSVRVRYHQLYTLSGLDQHTPNLVCTHLQIIMNTLAPTYDIRTYDSVLITEAFKLNA